MSSGFPAGTYDTAEVDGQRGSNVYEITPWLWQFGRGKPRLGGLSVEETFDRNVMHLICQNITFTDSTRRYQYINCMYMYIHATYMLSTCMYSVYTRVCVICTCRYNVLTGMCFMVSLIQRCCLLQDNILVIPPYPYCIEEDSYDVPLEDCWYARPQLLFTCYLRPKDVRAQKNSHYRLGPDDIRYHLVFFSTFEELKLPISGPIERAGVTKL